MNFRSKQSDSEPEISLTPLIDVVFLLLIFFMVTTTFSKEAVLSLTLPDATSEEKIDPQEWIITIQISKFGEHAVKGPEDDEPRKLINSSPKSLQRALEQAAGDINHDSIAVILYVDANDAHQSLIDALDAAANVGLTNIQFAVNNAE